MRPGLLNSLIPYLVRFIGGGVQFSKFLLNRYITPSGTAPTTGTIAPNKGLWFKPDGTIVYYGTGTAIRSWDLTTPWGVTTYTNNVISGNLLDTGGVIIGATGGICFQSDGLAIFVSDQTNNKLFKYTLGTAWDISSINLTAAQQIDLSLTGFTIPRGIYLDPSDTYLSVPFAATSARIITYTMSTPGDLTSAAVSDNIVLGRFPQAVHFIDNGTKMIAWFSDVLQDNQSIYTVTNPYRAGGPVLEQTNMVDTGGNTVGWTPYWRTDGEGYYYSNTSTNTINQLNLTADPAPTYRPDAFCVYKDPLLITSETTPTDLDFKPDGTVIYVIGATRDRPRQATLSTPWDLSTAGTQTELSGVLLATNGVTALASPTGITVTDSGTKMFIVDTVASTLYKYTLHTPYDITTAGTTSGDRIADQEVLIDTISAGTILNSHSVRFKSDGTKCITVNISSGGAGRRITVWDLSTAWDLSTISENSSSAVFTAAGFVGVHWTDDGTKIWSIWSSSTNDTLYYWELATPYDVSGINTGNYITRRDLDIFDSVPGGIYITADGAALYYVGSATDRIYNLTNN